MSMRRWMSLLLALCMVISMLPAGVLAVQWEAPAQEEPQAQPEQVEQERPAAPNGGEDDRTMVEGETITVSVKSGTSEDYFFTPERDGWYYMLIPADGKGYATLSLGSTHFAYGPYQLDEEYAYVLVGPLEAGVEYHVSLVNLSDLEEYTMSVSIHKCEPGTSLDFRMADSLVVGQSVDVYYYFADKLNQESIELTFNDDSILEVEKVRHDYVTFRAVKAGTVTVTMSTPSGLSCSRTVTVSEPIPMELGGTAELTLGPEETGYISFTTEEEGWYVLQTDNGSYQQCSVVSGFDYTHLGSTNDFDEFYRYNYIKLSPGYTVVRLTNSGSEQVTYQLHLEKAQKPTTINLRDVMVTVGSGIGVEATFDSYWHFDDIVWSIEGDAAVIDTGGYFCSIDAVKEGTAVLTASTLDGTATGSCTITVLGIPTLEIGVDNTVTLPADTSFNCIIEPEKSGFYMIDIEYEDAYYYLYVQTEHGLGRVPTEWDIVYLGVGKTYTLEVNPYGLTEAVTTSISILEATPLALDATVTAAEDDMLYRITVEQSGMYVFESYDMPYGIHLFQAADAHLEQMPLPEYWEEGMEYHAIHLTAGQTYYLLIQPEGNTVELMFRVCPPAEKFDLDHADEEAVVGGTFWASIYYPDYRRGNVTVTFSETGIVEISDIASNDYYFDCLKPGMVTITFTLDNGYSQSVTVTVNEAQVLTMDEQVQVELGYDRTQYFTFTAPESGYYVWYSTEGTNVYSYVHTGYESQLIDENGNCYFYFWLAEGEVALISLHNWDFIETIPVQTKIVKAQTPTALTLPEKVQPVLDCDYMLRAEFGSPWEYGEIHWTDTLQWEYRYYDGLICCINGPVTTGSVTATWYGENDTVLTATCVVEIINPPVMGVGELKTVELAGNSETAFLFVPEQTAAYYVSGNVYLSIYRVMEDYREYVPGYGSEYVTYYDLEEGQTYWIGVSNHEDTAQQISLCIDLPREAQLDVPVDIHLEAEMEKVLTFQAMEEGLYNFHFAGDEVRLAVSNEDYFWVPSGIKDGQEWVFSVYLYAGWYMLDIYAEEGCTGTLTIKQEKIAEVELELDKPTTVTVSGGGLMKFIFDGGRYGEGAYALHISTDSCDVIRSFGELRHDSDGRCYVFYVAEWEVAEWLLQFDPSIVPDVTIMVTRAKSPAELWLDNTQLTLTAGQEAALNVVFSPIDSWDNSLVWTSSDPDVVEVEGGGSEAWIMAKKPGTAYITVTSGNGVRAVCEVTVKAIEPVAELVLNEYAVYQMGYVGDFPVFSFTAPEAGYYFFALMSGEDCVLTLRDMEGKVLDKNDDYTNLNSGLWMSLGAGQTIYVEATLWNRECVEPLIAIVTTNDGVYHEHYEIYDDTYLEIIEPSGSEDGYLVFHCPHCGATIVIPYAEAAMMGDVNSDGEISVLDAMRVAQYIVGDLGEAELDTAAADVNGDGEISVLDAMRIAQYIVGDIPDFS